MNNQVDDLRKAWCTILMPDRVDALELLCIDTERVTGKIHSLHEVLLGVVDLGLPMFRADVASASAVGGWVAEYDRRQILRGDARRLDDERTWSLWRRCRARSTFGVVRSDETDWWSRIALPEWAPNLPK